jgi:hypothetical protein
MYQLMIALLSLLLAPAVLAFGDHGRWNDGWGQGVTEYSATVDDATYLYLSCRMGQLSRITLNQAGQAPTEAVSLRIDGHTYPPLPSMVAGNDSKTFYDMWAALRSAKSLQAITQDGRTVSLPVVGVQETLTAATDAAFDCAFPAPEPEPEPEQATAPLMFELQKSPGVLRVLSRNDQLAITGVTVNRGQCKVHEQTMGYDTKGNRIGYVPVFPLSLAFGKQAMFTMATRQCQVLEVVIHTDRGDASYTFE